MKIKRTIFNSTDNSKIWDDLVDYYLPDFDETNRLQMDEISLTFSLLVSMHYQIMNGGIVQFIDNESGNYFHETLDAAKRINFTELINILTTAAGQFPNKQVPKDWGFRRELWDKIADSTEEDFWETLDKSYFANEVNLYTHAIDYLKSHSTLID
jgi:hypothetical protein